MSGVYTVTVSAADKEDLFRIAWHEAGTNRQMAEFESSAADLDAEELERRWLDPRYQAAIGQKLYHFLDGDGRCLGKILDDAVGQAEVPQVHLCACKEAADWPFELLARDGSFLAESRLHLVRRVSDWGKDIEPAPQQRPLKLLFAACSALDVDPELDFEKEEETIFRVTEHLAVDMEVEDSGSLEGLRRQLVQTEYDVVHLSGHAGIEPLGLPHFIMEDETGHCRLVLPEELWQQALIENPPRLLFLSGCRTGQAPAELAAASFARRLAQAHQVPAVLGWGRPVADDQATHAEQVIYHELSRGKSILDAVRRARQELKQQFAKSAHPAWPLLRLFSGGTPLTALVAAGQKQKPQVRQMVHTYLKESQVMVLAEGFVGRRRQLQQSLHALNRDNDRVGVLLYGTGGLGKSCLAGKICERFGTHHLIIVHGRCNAVTMEAALKDAFLLAKDEDGKAVLAAEKEMSEKLAELCAGSFKERNYLILLDDFEQNLEGAAEGSPGRLTAETAVLLEAMLHYLPYSGKMTQLIVTCRYRFSLNVQGRDLVNKKLAAVCLTSFRDAEQRKKTRELEHIYNYPDQDLVPELAAAGRGSPRLMEWLDVLVGQMKRAEVAQLLDAIKDKQEEYIKEHVIRELLACGGEELAHFLQQMSVYRRPVSFDGAAAMAEDALDELVARGLDLSLVEHDRARESFRVTPLLREELLNDLDEEALSACHKAAFAYYKEVCEARETIDAAAWEEWIFHALGCGEEETATDKGGDLVKHLRDRLAFRESKRLGEWLLAKKRQAPATGDDAFLLNALALTLSILGEHRPAIDHLGQALQIDKKLYGEEHQEVATRLNNIGEQLRALGEPKRAKYYYEQALAIWKKVHGVSHPDVAVALNNLGLAWNALGETNRAIDYYKQALAILKKVHGESHQQVAGCLSNLGEAWRVLGESKKAIDNIEQALTIDRAVYGDGHPKVAVRLNNLGHVYLDLGDRERARQYLQQALTIKLKFFDPDHPSVKTTAELLAACEGK